MPQFDTAAQIINDVAVECGISAASNPFTSTDAAFVQLRTLLTSVGRELLGLHQWQKFIKVHSFNTSSPDTDQNKFNLPADFGYMFDQTYWTPTTRFPLGGPLSPQDWAYLVNTNLGPTIMYISFKVADNQIVVLPDPPPANYDINFQYASRYWAAAAASPTVASMDRVVAADDVVLYEPILMVKFLKLRFLESKGFDTTAALGQFNSVFMQWTGRNVTMPVLTLARNRVFPYLGYRNIPETNYGLP